MASRASPGNDGLRNRPQSSKRVRTGCWPCRRRHRKCDERRPTCDNCLGKGLTCQYPATFIFAPVFQPPVRETDDDSAASVPPQRAFTFVNGDAFDYHQPSSPERSPVAWQPEHTGFVSRGSDEPSDMFVFDGNALNQGDSAPGESCYTGTAGRLDIPPGRSSYSSPAGVSPSGGSCPEPSASVSATTEDKRSAVSEQPLNSVLSLLRYYRYQIAPLLELGDPWSSFSIEVPMMARSEGPVKQSVLALAIRHNSLRAQGSRTGRGEDIAPPQLEIDQGILGKDDPIRHISQSLSLFRDFSCLRPQQWRDFLTQRLPFQDTLSFVPSQHNLTDSAFWLLLKMDLAASLMSRTPLSITAPWVNTLSIPHEGDRRALLSYAYLSSVILLVRVVDLIYTQPEKPRSEHLERLTGPHEFHLNSESWTNLWHECQSWHRDRPLEMTPTMSVNILEAMRISGSESYHLPVLMFSSPSAVVANIAYHTACFLLMIRKPRLCQVANDRSQVASSTRHIQCIAGIATNNNFPSQWDPIVIAGLFRSARKLTHESQHEAVLQALQKVSAATGIRLEREIQELRDIQRASQREY